MTDHSPLAPEAAERGLLGKTHPGELANVVTHGLALLASIPAAFLVVKQASTTAEFWGVLIYGLTMIGAYAASTCLHTGMLRSVEHRVRYRLEVLDHVAIYFFIAGAFTPFILRVDGPVGTALLIGDWSAAIAGALCKIIFGLKYQRLSLASYLVLGWIPLLAIRPIMQASSLAAVLWLIIGGLAYTAGVPFFVAANRWPRLHAVWHLFVILGSAAHYVAVAETIGRVR